MVSNKEVISKIKKFIFLVNEGESEKVALGSLKPFTGTGINPQIMVNPYREATDTQYTQSVRKSLMDVLNIALVTDYFRKEVCEHLMGLYSGGQTTHVINEFIRIVNPRLDFAFSIFDEDFAEPLERLYHAELKKFNLPRDDRDETFFDQWKKTMRDHYQ